MPYRDLEPISKQLTIVVGLTVVGFMAFGLALSLYRSFLFEQTLGAIAAQNDDLRGLIEQGERDLEYYHSTQYKDKYAKEYLGRLRPGERVLIIIEDRPDTPVTEREILSARERQEAAYRELLRQMPVWEHWKLFLFQRDRIDALKGKL